MEAEPAALVAGQAGEDGADPPAPTLYSAT
jgi:hypothetical protein